MNDPFVVFALQASMIVGVGIVLLIYALLILSLGLHILTEFAYLNVKWFTRQYQAASQAAVKPALHRPVRRATVK